MSGFEVADPSERVLGLGPYLAGFAELAVIVAALAFASRRIRELLLPAWQGAPAWLAELVIASAALILISEALGTFGAFGEAEMLISVLVFAAVAALGCRRLAAGGEPDTSSPPGPAAGPVALTLAVVAVAAIVAGWMVPTFGSLAGGMDRADTLWYHMPLAAKFVQTGSLGDVFFFDPIFFASFYPSNSEVFHAVPILAFDRDIVSPLLNLGFLGIGLLACWCIGRPYGVAPQAMIGGGSALAAQMLVEFQAGEALNDITGVVFVLAAAALLVNGYSARHERSGLGGDAAVTGRRIATGALIVAGLAAGLAAGIKLSFLAPVAAMTVGVVAIAPAGTRRVALLAWTVPVICAGIYWYVRNAIATGGNPIPFVSSLGPIEIPAPERGFELRPGSPVAHYWNDTQVWIDWFVPGLRESFGRLWPVSILAMTVGAAYASWRGREPVLRMLGAMALFTAIAYLFTPLTAAGDEGQPIAFTWNVRYIAPAAAISLALIPCLPAARTTPLRRGIVTAGLSLLLAVTIASLVQWQQGHTKGALAGAMLVLVAAGAIALLRSRNLLGPAATRRSLVAFGVVVVALAGVAGWFEQRHYLERRYENTSPKLELADTLRWARDVRGAKIAVSGIRGVFNQYPLYGTDLSNEVQWLGYRGEHDAWLRIPSCEQWRRAINDGGYTHVVTTYDPFHPGRLSDTKESLWTREDPAARTVLRQGAVAVYEIEGEMDPAGCAGLPQLSYDELDGDSVNAEPLANQPPGTGVLDRRLSDALAGGDESGQ
jgi:hypothetical protein